MLITFLSLTSCVKKSDYDELNFKNEKLTRQVEELIQIRDSLNIEVQSYKNKQYKELTKKIENSTIYRTVEEASFLVKDYYEFSNRNFLYRNPKIKRVNNNKFKISVEECINKDGFKESDFHWNAQLYILEIKNDGTYLMMVSPY